MGGQSGTEVKLSGWAELSDAIVGRDRECQLLGGGTRVEEVGLECKREELVDRARRWWQANPLSSTPLYPTEGFRGWEVEHGGNGWAVEKNLTLVPGAPSQTCFVTSFE